MRRSATPARGSVLTLSMESVKASVVAPVVGSDDAEGRRAASRRCGGCAQSCRWHWSLDRGRSDPCWRHQQGSCGPAPIVLAHQMMKCLSFGTHRPFGLLSKHHVRKFSTAPILDLQLIAPTIRRLGRHEGTRGSNPEVEISPFLRFPREPLALARV